MGAIIEYQTNSQLQYRLNLTDDLTGRFSYEETSLMTLDLTRIRLYIVNLSNTYPLLAIGAYPTDGVLDPLPLLRSGVFSVAIILKKI